MKPRDLPPDWALLTVGELLEKKWLVDHMDGNHGSDYPRSEEFTNSGVPYISANALQSGRVNFQQAKYLTPERASRLRKGFAKDGDVLFAHNATVGPVAQLHTDQECVVLGTSLTYYRCDGTRLVPSYLKHFLESHFFVCQYQRLMGQSTRNQVPITAQRDFFCIIPPVRVQQKIAAILSTWDRAIELTEKLTAAKQKRKDALIQQLLVGNVRFQRFVKSAATTPTSYGTIPTDWQYLRLSELATEVSERNKGGTSYQVLSCTKYDGLVDSLNYFGRQIFSEDLATYKVVRRNQFAYATNHIEEGSIGYQNVCDTALISPMYTVFKTSDLVDDGFLYKVLKSNLYIHIYQVNTSASVDRRGSLRWSEFSQIRVPVPTLEEQRAIAEVIDTQQREIDLLGSKLDALRRQKKGLMQQLLTGKVRVNITGASGE